MEFYFGPLYSVLPAHVLCEHSSLDVCAFEGARIGRAESADKFVRSCQKRELPFLTVLNAQYG